jgi:hypothetical protein
MYQHELKFLYIRQQLWKLRLFINANPLLSFLFFFMIFTILVLQFTTEDILPISDLIPGPNEISRINRDNLNLISRENLIGDDVVIETVESFLTSKPEKDSSKFSASKPVKGIPEKGLRAYRLWKEIAEEELSDVNKPQPPQIGPLELNGSGYCIHNYRGEDPPSDGTKLVTFKSCLGNFLFFFPDTI